MNKRLGAAVLGLVLTASPVAASQQVEAAPAVSSASVTAMQSSLTQGIRVTATVPNIFYRDCSRITRRCTGYYQTNGPYNPSVPSRYYTRWVWRWI